MFGMDFSFLDDVGGAIADAAGWIADNRDWIEPVAKVAGAGVGYLANSNAARDAAKGYDRAASEVAAANAAARQALAAAAARQAELVKGSAETQRGLVNPRAFAYGRHMLLPQNRATLAQFKKDQLRKDAMGRALGGASARAGTTGYASLLSKLDEQARSADARGRDRTAAISSREASELAGLEGRTAATDAGLDRSSAEARARAIEGGTTTKAQASLGSTRSFLDAAGAALNRMTRTDELREGRPALRAARA